MGITPRTGGQGQSVGGELRLAAASPPGSASPAMAGSLAAGAGLHYSFRFKERSRSTYSRCMTRGPIPPVPRHSQPHPQGLIGYMVGLTARVMPEEGDGMLLRLPSFGRFLVAAGVIGGPAPAASEGHWRSGAAKWRVGRPDGKLAVEWGAGGGIAWRVRWPAAGART